MARLFLLSQFFKLPHFFIQQSIHKLRVNQGGFQLTMSKKFACCGQWNSKRYTGGGKGMPSHVAVNMFVVAEFLCRIAERTIEMRIFNYAKHAP